MISELLLTNIYKNLEDYNPNKKRKVLIVFDDMIKQDRDNNIFW